MPKVRVRSLRSLASKCNPSILTGAIIESADYIEELEKQWELLKVELKQLEEFYEKADDTNELNVIHDIQSLMAKMETAPQPTSDGMDDYHFRRFKEDRK